LSEEGPDHAKEFTATVVVAGDSRGVGQGRTKKEAEQKAAALAYGALTPAPADGADSSPDPDSTGDEQSGSTEALDTADAPVTSA
jgi:ribonuclease-3